MILRAGVVTSIMCTDLLYHGADGADRSDSINRATLRWLIDISTNTANLTTKLFDSMDIAHPTSPSFVPTTRNAHECYDGVSVVRDGCKQVDVGGIVILRSMILHEDEYIGGRSYFDVHIV